MPCTTILVGKDATNDRSTMIARTDDGFFDVKKTVVVEPERPTCSSERPSSFTSMAMTSSGFSI